MKIYIARGAHSWAASLDRHDAMLRALSANGDYAWKDGEPQIQLASTEGNWTVSPIDGTITSDAEIIQEEVDREEALSAASYALARIASTLDGAGLHDAAELACEVETAVDRVLV